MAHDDLKFLSPEVEGVVRRLRKLKVEVMEIGRDRRQRATTVVAALNGAISAVAILDCAGDEHGRPKAQGIRRVRQADERTH